MSNPNEVTDVEPKRTLMHSLTTGRAYLKPEYAEAALAEYVAQQNAALLRELSEKAVEVNMVQYHYEDGSKVIAGWTNSAIPASILEAKLKELEEQL